MKTIALLAGTLAGSSYANEYFTGDGTAYTLGQTSAGNCNLMSALDFATTDYAALNNEQWDGLQHCGRCAEVSCADDRCADQSKSTVVQILDRCPECKHGDLDLSPSVFQALTGSTPSRYKIKWKFVDCPVSGNVNYCLKGGSNNFWMGVQPTNCATGVKSLKINGKDTTMLGSAYYYLLDGASETQTDLSSLTISVTDVNGYMIEDTVSLTADSCQEGSKQFPAGTPVSPTSQQTVPSSEPTVAPATQATPTLTPTATSTPSPTLAPTEYTTPTSTPTPALETQAPHLSSTVRSPSAIAQSYPQQEILHTTAPPAFATSTTIPSATVAPSTLVVPIAPSAPAMTASPTLAPVTIAPTLSLTQSPAMDGIAKAGESLMPFKQSSSVASPTTPTLGASVTTPTVEATQSTVEQTEQHVADDQASDAVQTVSTRTNESSGGTDPLLIVLSTLGGVGVVALVVVVVIARKKRIQEEKVRDFDERAMVSAEPFDTPSERRQAMIGIL